MLDISFEVTHSWTSRVANIITYVLCTVYIFRLKDQNGYIYLLVYVAQRRWFYLVHLSYYLWKMTKSSRQILIDSVPDIERNYFCTICIVLCLILLANNISGTRYCMLRIKWPVDISAGYCDVYYSFLAVCTFWRFMLNTCCSIRHIRYSGSNVETQNWCILWRKVRILFTELACLQARECFI